MKKTIICAALAVGICPGLMRDARAQGQTPKGAVAVTDPQFAMMAAMSDMAEIMTSKMAMQQATNAQVKAFAQQMVADHTRTSQEMMTLAAAKQMALPQALDARHQAMVDQLKQAQGPAFDQQYMMGQVRAHDEAVALFQAEATNGRDADLKGFATRTLPALQMHQMMARDVSSQVGGAAPGR